MMTFDVERRAAIAAASSGLLVLVRCQSMDDAPERNPLGLVVAAFVITLPFDYDSYLIHRDLSEFGILIIVTKAVFFVLYLLGSRFAWHVGFVLIAVLTALALLLIHRGAKASELD